MARDNAATDCCDKDINNSLRLCSDDESMESRSHILYLSARTVRALAYLAEVLPLARRLLEERRLRPLFLVEGCDARVVTEQELRDVDPELESLRDCNTPDAYRDALRAAGLGEGVV